jgi:hypothetical protein
MPAFTQTPLCKAMVGRVAPSQGCENLAEEFGLDAACRVCRGILARDREGCR